MRVSLHPRSGLFVLCLVLAVVGTGTLRQVSAVTYDQVVDAEERFYVVPGGWLEALSCGYNEALGMALWVKAVLYFSWRWTSEASGLRDDPSFDYRLMSSVVALNPRVPRFYEEGSTFILFQSDGITGESVEYGIELLEDGLQWMPDRGDLTCSLGMYHYYEMEPFLPADSDDPKRRYHKREGARLIRRSSLMDHAPSYASGLGLALSEREEGFDDVLIGHLEAMLAKDLKPSVRRRVERKLQEALGSAAEVRLAFFERVRSQWRSELPFVSFELFLLLRGDVSVSEIVEPLDWSNRVLGIVNGAEGVGGAGSARAGLDAAPVSGSSGTRGSGDAGLADGGRVEETRGSAAETEASR